MAVKIFVTKDDAQDILQEIMSTYLKNGTAFEVVFIKGKMEEADVALMMRYSTGITDIFGRIGPNWWADEENTSMSDLRKAAAAEPAKLLKSIIIVNTNADIGLAIGYNGEDEGRFSNDRDYKVALRW